MNLYKISFILLFLCISLCGFAQQSPVDSVLHLKTVEVASSRLSQFATGNKTETVDSATLNRYTNNNLADLLTNESLIFVKSYGLGSLATTSFRGAGASHTAVLWNGFSLNSPFYGQLDMSLVPLNFMNNVSLQYGGAGALWGSGAVGGTILLNNSSDLNKGISVFSNTSYGSFADRQQQLGAEVSRKKFTSSIKAFYHDAKNDFSFRNTAASGFPEQKQSNAELKQCGLMQENYFMINTHQKLNTHFWYQNSYRNIPPSMTSNSGVSNQQDESYRGTAEWQRTGDRFTVFARAAYFDEVLVFKDSLVKVNSRARSKTTIAEAESRFHILKFDLVNIGINNTYSDAISPDYPSSPHQNRMAMFASYKIHSKESTWNVLVSGRQEWIEDKPIPFTASAGMDGKFLKCFYIKANAAKLYRVPTFNDLFYFGAGGNGNPNLKPESGWSEEAGLINKYNIRTFSWELEATVFNRNINNWIVWLPVSFTIWSPENAQSVWSRGVEYKANINYEFHKFLIQVKGNYNYVLSTNEGDKASTGTSYRKQLIYVPVQNAQGSLSLSFKGFSFTYTQIYVGYRYTTSDNLLFLKPYTIRNVSLCKLFSFKNMKIKIYAQLNNILNEEYQVLAYNAMPGLNWQAGVAITAPLLHPLRKESFGHNGEGND